ncbi:hypothetical protein [Microbacterium aurantiacum]|uniref:hypothetical protein n=1 Tax=Microbacterium aurantiacum TaxID=162393 RepID=UPI000C807097|nr:hypothetical protein [Microbacterium aurantiacum]
MSKDPKTQAKADQNDLITGIIVGALAIGFLVYSGISRISDLFAAPGAITVKAPVGTQEITADVGSGATATIDSATLVVDGVSTISVVCLVVAIIVEVLGLIAVAALGVMLCRRLARGIVFDAVNLRLTFGASISLLAAGLGQMWFQNMGLNGVFAALGDEFEGQTSLLMRALPFFVAAIAVGVLVIVFRRGIRLQRETEGLV